jgi:hypothetical protein
MPAIHALRWPPPEKLVFHCPHCGYRTATRLGGDQGLTGYSQDHSLLELEHRVVRCDLCSEEFGLRISRNGKAYGDVEVAPGQTRTFSYLAADLEEGRWITGQLYQTMTSVSRTALTAEREFWRRRAG